MEFTKYSSIDNVDGKGVMDRMAREAFDQEQWQVTEKIDGSHYEIYVTETDVQPAKRTSMLGEEASFFNHGAVYDELKDKARVLYNALKRDGLLQPDSQVRLCGELYGEHILNRVPYGDGPFFAGYDIYIDKAPMTTSAVEFYLDQIGIEHAHIHKAKVSFQEALDFPNDLPTHHCHRDKLPEDLTCEGVVLKPIHPMYTHTGGRVILKHKNQRFEEKSGSTHKKAERKVLDPEAQSVLDTLMQYATESRMYSVVSKIGTFGQKDFGKLQGLFLQDLIADAEKEEGFNLKEDYKDFQREIKRRLGFESASIVRKVFLALKQ